MIERLPAYLVLVAILILGFAFVWLLASSRARRLRREIARHRSLSGWLLQMRVAQVGAAFTEPGAPDIMQLQKTLHNVGVQVIITRRPILGIARRPQVYDLEKVGADVENQNIILVVDGDTRS